MNAGGPALAEGTVWHRRSRPTTHEFSMPVSYVWLDPDDPGGLMRHHPLWTVNGWGLVRFRTRDYGPTGTASEETLADLARTEVQGLLGRRPVGPVRMLTQLRRLGWLFNPITVYVVWDAGENPVGAVLEVTNTPWKERLRYPLLLSPVNRTAFGAEFEKDLHVSPFLGLDHRYRLSITGSHSRMRLAIDVLDEESDEPVVATSLDVELRPPSRRTLGRSLRVHSFSTLLVSLGIHGHALRLLAKHVPFVPHPPLEEIARS